MRVTTADVYAPDEGSNLNTIERSIKDSHSEQADEVIVFARSNDAAQKAWPQARRSTGVRLIEFADVSPTGEIVDTGVDRELRILRAPRLASSNPSSKSAEPAPSPSTSPTTTSRGSGGGENKVCGVSVGGNGGDVAMAGGDRPLWDRIIV